MQDAQTEFSPAGQAKPVPAVGRKIALSAPRQVMCDLLAIAHAVPTVPVQRHMNLAPVVAARARLAGVPDCPGWVAIFTRAYGFVSMRFPELRRAYLSFPTPHLYEHPHSIASIAIERQYEEENAVFWGHLRRPEQIPLRDLQSELTRYKTAPLRDFGLFRRVLLVGRLPKLLRRLVWWIGLNVSGRKRANYFGTFGISVYSSLGAESLHPITPLTTALTYGPIGKDGNVAVRIVYDHRVLDGATVARALAYLEEVLNREIVAELGHLAPAQAA